MRTFSIPLILCMVLCAALLIQPRIAYARVYSADSQKEGPVPARVPVTDGSNVHNVGELLVHVGNWGIFGSMPGTGVPFAFAPSAEWPAGSGVEHLFISGLWVGAKKNDIPAVSTAAFEFELRPTDDPIDVIYRSFEGDAGGIRWPSGDADDDGDGEVDEDWLDGRDNDGDGLIDEDFAAISDQMFSCWFTDDQTIVADSLYAQHEPLPILVRQESYQWKANRFDDFVGIRYNITNIGTEVLEDLYLGFLADCDIGSREQFGYWEDDAAGNWFGDVDTEFGTVSVRMAYAYDTEGDGTLTTSHLGVVMLGHTVDPLGIYAPQGTEITSLQIFRGEQPYEYGGDPVNDFQRYEVLAMGLIDRGSEGGDYRVLIGTGPFPSVGPGETIEIHIALAAGDGLEGLIDNAAMAQRLFEGTWFDIDGDPATGVDGKETQVHWLIEAPSVTLNVLDIKPCSCPNPFNVKLFDFLDDGKENKGGVLPVAILGTDDFDVSDVDVSTVLLEGVAPLLKGIGYEDVSRPVENGSECECTSEGPDGFADLTLKFSSLEIAEALLAGGAAAAGEVRQLTLSGELFDGTEFEASDCVTFVGKGQESEDRGERPRLRAAAPNPFNPMTRISYYLPYQRHVLLSVYDVSGRLVSVLDEGMRSAGEHVVEWNAGRIESGVYFYRLKAGDFAVTRKAVLLR